MISHFNLDHSNQYILDGDFNSLSHKSLIQTGLQSIYYGPTHRGNNLDRLYGINIDAKLFNSATYVSHIKTQVPPANLTSTLMPIHSIVILLLYLARPTILNPHISYQNHTILIISHLLLYIIL